MNRITERSKRMRKGGVNGAVAQSVIIFYLVLMVFFTLLPVIITVILSLKTEQDISTGSLWSLPKVIQWENYSSAIVKALPNMGITLFIDIVSVVAMTLLSAFSAYIFVRKRFPGRNFLFYLVILPMLVPGVVSLTPQYLNIVQMNLLGSWFAVILPYIAGNQIASIFLFRTFMTQHPRIFTRRRKLTGREIFALSFRLRFRSRSGSSWCKAWRFFRRSITTICGR